MLDNKYQLVLLVIIFSFFFTFNVYGLEEKDLYMYSSEFDGLGGILFSLYNGSPAGLVNNPSLLNFLGQGGIEFLGSYVRAGAGEHKVLELIKSIKITSGPSISFDPSSFTNYSIDTLLKLKPNVYAGINVIGMWTKNFCFMIMSRANASAEIGLSPGLPYIQLQNTTDILSIITGFAFNIYEFQWGKDFPRISGGVNFKFSYRIKLDYPRISLLDIEAYKNIKEIDFYKGLGFSADLAFSSFIPNINSYFYVVFSDLFNRFTYTKAVASTDLKDIKVVSGEAVISSIPTKINLGWEYKLDKIFPITSGILYTLGNFIVSDLIGVVEIHNINNFSENFFNKVHMGVSATFFDILKPRIGINQGYITLGLGVKLLLLSLDISYFIEETSVAPGLMPRDNLSIKLNFNYSF